MGIEIPFSMHGAMDLSNPRATHFQKWELVGFLTRLPSPFHSDPGPTGPALLASQRPEMLP